MTPESSSGSQGPSDRIPILNRLREAGSHTIIYGLGSALQTGIGFILIPLYTRQFTVATYGAFSLITLVGVIAGTALGLGAASAMGRSYFDYSTVEDQKAVVGTSLRITLAGAAAQILLGLLLSRFLSKAIFNTPEYSAHVFVAVCAGAVNSINSVFYVLLRFLRRSRQVVLLNLFSLVVTSGLILYFLLGLGWGLMAPLIGTLAGRVLTGGALAVASRDRTSLRWYRHELKLQLAYGIPNMMSGLLFYGLDTIDRFFVNHYMTLTDVGIYSLGYKIGTVIQFFFVMPFSQIWAPMRVEYRHEQNSPELFSLVLTYFWLIGVLMTVTISGFSDGLIAIVSGRPEYAPASVILPIIMFAQLVYGTINIMDNGIVFDRKMMYHVYGFAIALTINIVLNILLIPRWGYMAAAWITLLSYAVVVVIAGTVSHRLYPVPWEWGRLIHIGLTGFVALLIMQAVSWSVVGILLKSGTVIALICWWYVLLLARRERKWIRAGVRAVFGRSV